MLYPRKDFEQFNPEKLEQYPPFEPNFIGDNYTPIFIASVGLDNTTIGKAASSRMLFPQVMEGLAMDQEVPGIFVSYLALTPAEERERETIFGSKRPDWITVAEGRSFKSFRRQEVPPLDQAILSDPKVMDKIKLAVEKKARETNKPLVLMGYHATPAMQEIARILQVPYLGSPEFAAGPGTKIGLAEFLTKYDLPQLPTFLYPQGVCDDNLEKLERDLTTLASQGFSHAVFKLNSSTGGEGHLHTEIEIVEELLLLNESLKIVFPSGEGFVMQGWLEKKDLDALASIDFTIDFDGTCHFQWAKTKFVTDDVPKESGYLPIHSELLKNMEKLLPKIAAAYSAENALGPHCVNVIFPNKATCDRIGIEHGVPLIHDENTRPGVGKMIHSFTQHIKNGEAGVGWGYQPTPIYPTSKVAEALYKRLKQENLLIRRAGERARGVFLPDSAYFQYHIQSIGVLALSPENDLEEIVNYFDRVQKVLREI